MKNCPKCGAATLPFIDRVAQPGAVGSPNYNTFVPMTNDCVGLECVADCGWRLTIADLEAIIAQFSTTKDGKPAMPGSTLYLYVPPPGCGIHTIKVDERIDYCWYSTPELARKAAEAVKEGWRCFLAAELAKGE